MGALLSKPSDNWKALGISHPLHVLKREWPRVVLKSIDEQAAYADAVCRREVNNDAFLEDQLGDHSPDQLANLRPQDLPFNTTGVGNLAYLALHATDKYRAEYINIHTAHVAKLRLLHFPQTP